MTLNMEEFARRFLQHVLPVNFRKICYCGIFAKRTQSVTLAACRKALKVKPPEPKPKLDWKEKLYQLTGIDPNRCPKCEKGSMQLVEVIAQPRPPPQNGAVLDIYIPVVVLPAID